jgi:membrane protease YdiL (CAAX protease family)
MGSETGFKATVRRRPLLSFFVLAYLLNAIVDLPMVLSPAGLGLINLQVPELWLIAGATTPTIAALTVQWLSEGNLNIFPIGRPPWRILAGAVAGIVLVLLAFAVLPALILSKGAYTGLHWSVLLAVSAGYWINPLNLLGGPLNEEPGWRGFALPRLQARFGALKASLILGVLWAGWHAPLFLIKGWAGTPPWAFVVLIISLSVLMTLAVNLSRGGIVASVLMHAVFNTSFPMLVGLCRGVPTLEPGLPIYVATAALTALAVVLVTRGRLGQAPAPAG